MLHDSANHEGYVALKLAAEDRRMETERKFVKNLLFSRLLMMTTSVCLSLCVNKKFQKLWIDLDQTNRVDRTRD